MWVKDAHGVWKIQEVRLWVLCTGIQGDHPQRMLLSRRMKGANAYRGCDRCGLITKEGGKYLGYSEPIECDLHCPEGGVQRTCMAWANGVVDDNTVGSLWGNETPETVCLTAIQRRAQSLNAIRRKTVEVPAGLDHKSRKDKLDKIHRETGAHGRSEFELAGLGYWNDHIMFHVAVYHTTYLGPGKGGLKWFLNCDRDALPPGKPKDFRSLVSARRSHFVLRNKPDCIMVDPTLHMGKMTMSEMQLWWEVGMPYIAHDLMRPIWGVPQEAVLCIMLLRHAMIANTRLLGKTKLEYQQQLLDGKVCAFASGWIAQHHSKDTDKGNTQFGFTWKLHQFQHLPWQFAVMGFTINGNDTWVERLMRHWASRICKCAPVPPSCAYQALRMQARVFFVRENV